MEHYSVNISHQARADMRGILYYIAAHLREPSTADHMLNRFEEAALSLETMPKRFALVPDNYLASMGFRMASVGNYLLFYIADSDTHTVNISRVLYGKQDWVKLLTKTVQEQ